jgi:hypothetical protein
LPVLHCVTIAAVPAAVASPPTRPLPLERTVATLNPRAGSVLGADGRRCQRRRHPEIVFGHQDGKVRVLNAATGTNIADGAVRLLSAAP